MLIQKIISIVRRTTQAFSNTGRRICFQKKNGYFASETEGGYIISNFCTAQDIILNLILVQLKPIDFMERAGLSDTILTWNKGAELIKGYKAEEIIGQNFGCFIFLWTGNLVCLNN